ncbi:hypothetical protein [Brevundimonas sp.]|uniref:hypothetical protein n=1 Tax=Brevundimonas sp. TaxID=1871086 RepID=UPI003D0F6652
MNRTLSTTPTMLMPNKAGPSAVLRECVASVVALKKTWIVGEATNGAEAITAEQRGLRPMPGSA